MRTSIAILMQSVPGGMSVEAVRETMESVEGVIDAHHVHVWPIDERHISVEAHLAVEVSDLQEAEDIKRKVRQALRDQHDVEHSTLELESSGHCDFEEHELPARTNESP